jgi:hypothetical protein
MLVASFLKIARGPTDVLSAVSEGPWVSALPPAAGSARDRQHNRLDSGMRDVRDGARGKRSLARAPAPAHTTFAPRTSRYTMVVISTRMSWLGREQSNTGFDSTPPPAQLKMYSNQHDTRDSHHLLLLISDSICNGINDLERHGVDFSE